MHGGVGGRSCETFPYPDSFLFHICSKKNMRFPHPFPANKKKAVEVLTAVFGGGSEKVADGQRGERTGVVSPISEN
jgi:hypothetical protein